ncbi:MAG TPA: type II secretion system protein N [Patescibacteria group bacterium]|nr:type II secretion system protein N [Patescibacteria group bacterium]
MEQGQVGGATPEKKLLKIIETGGAKGAGPEAVKADVVKKIKKPGLPLAALFTRLSGAGTQFKAKLSPDAILATDVKKINVLLMVGALVIAAYLVVGFATRKKDSGRDMFRPSSKEQKMPDISTVMPKVSISMSETETLGTLLERLKKRDYFKPVAKQQKKAPAEKAGPVSTQAIDQATESLRLVGISYAANSKDSYVMIEDLASKITYFVKVNQAISGVKVTDIQKDRVLLTYQGQEKEMR